MEQNIHWWWPKKDDSCFPFFLFFFQYVLEVAQSDHTRRDATALGVIRTLSRIDRFWSFYLGGTWFPLLVSGCWEPWEELFRLPLLVIFLQQLHDEHRFTWPILCTGWIFQVFLHKAMEITTLSYRSKQPCIGAKLLITSIVLRACGNLHLGTLMRCCEAWKPIEDCIDILRCIDFKRHSNIFASFSRENFQAREAEVSTFPWTQIENSALSRCRNGQRVWRNRKLVLVLIQMQMTIPWSMKMNLPEDFVSTGETFSKHDRRARDIMNMKIFCDLFKKLQMT